MRLLLLLLLAGCVDRSQDQWRAERAEMIERACVERCAMSERFNDNRRTSCAEGCK